MKPIKLSGNMLGSFGTDENDSQDIERKPMKTDTKQTHTPGPWEIRGNEAIAKAEGR